MNIGADWFFDIDVYKTFVNLNLHTVDWSSKQVFLTEMSAKSTSRHYTHVEKEIFLDLLNEFKDIIENKKSDSAALKHKEYAWKQIEEAYNSCHVVSQQVSYSYEPYTS